MAKIQIDERKLKELERRVAKLDALEAGGVDNWDGIDFALEGYRETIEREETIEEIVNEIADILCTGAYEPSERGAGWAFNSSALDSVAVMLDRRIKAFKDPAP